MIEGNRPQQRASVRAKDLPVQVQHFFRQRIGYNRGAGARRVMQLPALDFIFTYKSEFLIDRLPLRSGIEFHAGDAATIKILDGLLEQSGADALATTGR